MNYLLKELIERYSISEEDSRSLESILQNRMANLSAEFTISEPTEGSLVDTGETTSVNHLPVLDFQSLDILGVGASSIVHKVHDDLLSRNMAMKIVKESIMNSNRSLRRFIKEAQITARLQHPNILSVHQLAQHPDGRIFFTMPEVKGQTFLEVIQEFHSSKQDKNLRRLIDILRKSCDAIGYAHSQQVIHRDIKPSNIMVGNYGEVWVVDWGLAKDLSKPDSEAKSVVGTPVYMSPEQAKGEKLSPHSDVYSLGCILYYILTASPPYIAVDGGEVIRQILEGRPPSVQERSSENKLDLDEELIRICERAMARDPQSRYQDANELRKEISDWQDGILRRGKALELVYEAENLIPQATTMIAKASSLREDAKDYLQAIPSWSEESKKVTAWRKEEIATALEQKANLELIRGEQLLHAALTYVPNLQEAHILLSNRYRTQHSKAEYTLNKEEMEKSEAKLRVHVNALPDGHPRKESHFAYLRGTGALSITTDPEGVEVLLHRYDIVNRRLKAEFLCVLGKTPIRKYPMPMGSYLLILRKKGYHEVRYPIYIARQEHWDGIPPHATEILPIKMPPKGSLEENESYVPAGWFWSGGDPKAQFSLPLRRIWVDSFVIQRFPTSNGDYLSFLNHLIQQEEETTALQHVPCEQSGTLGGKGEMIYGLSRRGWFYLKQDSEGNLWDENWPVLKVTWDDATVFSQYLSKKTGKKWILPNEIQWEKAARAVDKRKFPWGDFMDPVWTCMRYSHNSRKKPRSIFSTAVDISPFGVYGMGGNARDMTSSRFSIEGPNIKDGRLVEEISLGSDEFFTAKGGSWYDNAQFIRCCSRSSEHRKKSTSLLSFRLIRYPNW
ncbi:MAG: protein kinase [Myxococcota bacterium]|nr:protein kinase [Myxococcota bacterium]